MYFSTKLKKNHPIQGKAAEWSDGQLVSLKYKGYEKAIIEP